MENLKFRQPIRNQRNGDFINWTYWGIIEGEYIRPSEYYMEKYDTKKESQQFIGLIDNNSKEIFVGDIVKSGNGRLWEVKFGQYCYYNNSPALGFYLDGGNCHFPMGFKNNNLEIIGNITESKKLKP